MTEPAGMALSREQFRELFERAGTDDGEGIDEEDCWLGQPPIRNADTALTAVICVATTSSRLRAW